jgi:putative transposase
MPDYRRNQAPGGTFFLTVNLLDRRSDLLVTKIDLLREAIRRVPALHQPCLTPLVVAQLSSGVVRANPSTSIARRAEGQ